MSGEVERPAAVGDGLPTLADAATGSLPADRVDPARSLPQLHATAVDRARWYGRKLAEQVAVEGDAGLLGDEVTVDATGVPHKTGEYVRALARLEAEERNRAERIAATMSRLGLLQAAQTAANRAEGARMARFAEVLLTSLGLDWSDEQLRRAAQLAIIEVFERERTGGAQS